MGHGTGMCCCTVCDPPITQGDTIVQSVIGLSCGTIVDDGKLYARVQTGCATGGPAWFPTGSTIWILPRVSVVGSTITFQRSGRADNIDVTLVGDRTPGTNTWTNKNLKIERLGTLYLEVDYDGALPLGSRFRIVTNNLGCCPDFVFPYLRSAPRMILGTGLIGSLSLRLNFSGFTGAAGVCSDLSLFNGTVDLPLTGVTEVDGWTLGFNFATSPSFVCTPSNLRATSMALNDNSAYAIMNAAAAASCPGASCSMTADLCIDTPKDNLTSSWPNLENFSPASGGTITVTEI